MPKNGKMPLLQKLCFLLWLASSLAMAQPQENWKDLTEQGRALLSTDPIRAAQVLQRALELVPSSQPLERAYLHGFLGQALFDQKRFAEAALAFERCQSQLQGKDPKNRAQILLWLGRCRFQTQEFESACLSTEEGLALCQAQGPLNSKLFYDSLHLLRVQAQLDRKAPLGVTASHLLQSLRAQASPQATAAEVQEIGVLCYQSRHYALATDYLVLAEQQAQVQQLATPEFLAGGKEWLALAQVGLGQQEAAVVTYQELLKLVRSHPKLAANRETQVAIGLGCLLADLNRSKEALELLTAIERLPSNSPLLSPALESKAECLQYLSREEEAVIAYSQALSGASPTRQAKILELRATCYATQTQPDADKALRDIDSCLALRQGGEAGLWGQALYRKGTILLHLHRYDEALAVLEKAAAQLADQGGARLGLTLSSLAHLLFLQGDFQMALEVGERALSELSDPKSSSLQRTVAQAYKQQARRYLDLGDPQGAQTTAKKALEIYQRSLTLQHPETLDCVFLLAETLRAQGHISQSLQLVQTALPALETLLGPRDRRMARAHLDMAQALSAAGQNEAALQHIQSAESIDRQHSAKTSLGLAVTLAELARHHLHAGNAAEAYPLAHEAATIISGRGPLRTLSDLVAMDVAAEACLAIYHSGGERSHLQEAGGWLSAAVEASRHSRELVDDRSRREQSRRLLDLYPRAVEVAVAQGDLNRALELAELSASRALLELMAGNVRPSASRERVRQVLAHSGVKLQSSGASAVIDPLPSQALQAPLRDDEAVLYFLLGPSVSHGFVVDKNAISYFALPSRASLEAPAQALAEQLAQGGVRGSLLGQTRVSEKGRIGLGKLLWSGLSPEQRQRLHGKSLIVVATGRLLEIPFEVLPPLPGEEGRFLVDTHPIAYAPSLSLLAHLRSRGPNPVGGRTLVVADPIYPSEPQASSSLARRYRSQDGDLAFAPLPFTRVEAEAISQTLGKQHCEVWLGEEASEQKLTHTDLSGYRILHFACHGILGRQLGLGPSLVLSQQEGGAQDGFLTMAEVAALKPALRADLVVLSACQTGQGRFQPGEGVESMARSFLRSGAQSVLVSLWTVDDRSTARLMERFYGYLSAPGMRPSVALRRAQQDLIKQGSPPGHWAPFVLIGDDRAVSPGK